MQAIESCNWPLAGQLRILGSGNEAIVLTDGKNIFKVFDNPTESTRNLLRSFVDRLAGRKHLPHPVAFLQNHILVYPYEETTIYQGEFGPALVELLWECHQEQIVCRNIHPDNLRVARDGRVILVDLGRDIVPFSMDEFQAMCRRTFLAWRFWHRKDLKDLMRSSLLPELDGFSRFYKAVRLRIGLEVIPDPLYERLLALNPQKILFYGCMPPSHFAHVAFSVTVCDPFHRVNSKQRESLQLNGMKVLETLCPAETFDLVVCSDLFCTVTEESALTQAASDLRQAVSNSGRILVSVCHPSYCWRAPLPDSYPRAPPNAHPDLPFPWERLRNQGKECFQEMHWPERVLRNILTGAGLFVRDRLERFSVDVDRFERAADTLVLELEPMSPLPPVSLLIKACAMDSGNLKQMAQHLIEQLETPRPFIKRLLVLDSRVDGFTRAHSPGNLTAALQACEELKTQRFIDRIISGPTGKEAALFNSKYFGINTPSTHSTKGAQIAATLAGFEACSTRYLFQTDVDIMIGRVAPLKDYLAEMISVLEKDEKAVTISLNIARREDVPFSFEELGVPWRTEVRICLLDLHRLRTLLPLPNSLDGEHLSLSWHRSLDLALREPPYLRSYRGGSNSTIFVHPENSWKLAYPDRWNIAVAQLENCRVPPIQFDSVNWKGDLFDWVTPLRFEPFVFIILGRNVPPGRFYRCLESVIRQKRKDWGAIVIDDASSVAISSEQSRITSHLLGSQGTFLRFRTRRGGMANLYLALKHLCGNTNSVIITLDADDCLLGDTVLDRLFEAYSERGADLTVGSMLRTDKFARYPVNFENPRESRGGNVWQHLRSFKKYLFDQIPREEFELDGKFIDLAYDWAFMLPMVELAKRPQFIEEYLYLYEPSGEGKKEDREERERVIGRIVQKKTRSRL